MGKAERRQDRCTGMGTRQQRGMMISLFKQFIQLCFKVRSGSQNVIILRGKWEGAVVVVVEPCFGGLSLSCYS